MSALPAERLHLRRRFPVQLWPETTLLPLRYIKPKSKPKK
jgi:hypothetical protein